MSKESPFFRAGLVALLRRARRKFQAERQRVQRVDPEWVLDRLSQLEVLTWSYKWDPPSVRHIGPMAQDFAAAFQLGGDDRRINMADASGVALASIQALKKMIEQQTQEIEALRQELRALDSPS